MNLMYIIALSVLSRVGYDLGYDFVNDFAKKIT
jgi:hypothetical protein